MQAVTQGNVGVVYKYHAVRRNTNGRCLSTSRFVVSVLSFCTVESQDDCFRSSSRAGFRFSRCGFACQAVAPTGY